MSREGGRDIVLRERTKEWEKCGNLLLTTPMECIKSVFLILIEMLLEENYKPIGPRSPMYHVHKKWKREKYNKA